MLLGAAEDVARFDVPVGVPEFVQPPQSTHSMAQRLYTYVWLVNYLFIIIRLSDALPGIRWYSLMWQESNR